MVNPIHLVVSCTLAVALFWLCYETYERRGFEKFTAILSILPALVLFLARYFLGSGSYYILLSVLISVAVMCGLYLILFWGRIYLDTRKNEGNTRNKDGKK